MSATVFYETEFGHIDPGPLHGYVSDSDYDTEEEERHDMKDGERHEHVEVTEEILMLFSLVSMASEQHCMTFALNFDPADRLISIDGTIRWVMQAVSEL
jgi:hypothetical protein